MSRHRVLFLLAIGLVLAVHPMLASTFAVGTCKPSLPSYPTISAAVSSVPPGSTVDVCPGTYPEQVTITYPLTLKGITSANAGQAVITVPGSGLAVVTTGLGYSIAAQVAVTATAGPVNISDLTVDGTGNTVGGSDTWLVGILYDDGSSGTVNEVTVRNLNNSGFTAGVWAENSTATNESVTIENSSFHDIDDYAVVTETNQPPTLSAAIKGNSMAVSGSGSGVFLAAGGSFTGNVISGGFGSFFDGPSTVSANTVTNASFVGMEVVSPATVSGNTVTNSGTYGMILFFATASGNTVANSPIGIYAAFGATATTNKISNASIDGIYDGGGGGNTYKSNAIAKVGVGIEFNCQSPTVVSNTINDAATGLNDVPAGFSSPNSFNNVVTLRTDGCSSGPIHGPDLPAPPSGPMRAPGH